MIAKSIYSVQRKIIGLGEKPFLNKEEVRPAFHSIFNNEHCFSDHHTLFYEENRPTPLPPNAPFIKNLGQICINARSINLRADIENQLGHIITGRKKYWEPNARIEPINDYFSTNSEFSFQKGELFGLDPLVEDQRMNFLYFELYKPLFIKATYKGETMAQGKVFIHLYPSGFIYFLLSISLNTNHIYNTENIKNAFREIRPQQEGTWLWNSKFGLLQLNKLFGKIQNATIASIMMPKNIIIRDNNWRSFTKIINLDKNIEIPKNFMKGEHETLTINHLLGEGEHEFDKLISSKQGFFLLMSDAKKRRETLKLFWKLSKILEYICLMDVLYKDYTHSLKQETVKLKEYRFNFQSKLSNEDVFTKNVYDHKMVRFMQVMEGHIHTTTGFYRRIYSSFWNGIDFGKRRSSFKKALAEWENEIAQWDSPLAAVYKKIISPIRRVLHNSGR